MDDGNCSCVGFMCLHLMHRERPFFDREHFRFYSDITAYDNIHVACLVWNIVCFLQELTYWLHNKEMSMTSGDILVVGSLNMDQVVRVPRLPALGEALLGAGSLRLVPGGKGANQAVAMARLGAPVVMAGRVGKDG